MMNKGMWGSLRMSSFFGIRQGKVDPLMDFVRNGLLRSQRPPHD